MNGKKPEDRLERIVSDLLRGRRLKLRGGDAEEKAAITAAARLAGTSQGPQRMHQAFRRKLAQRLEEGAQEAWLTRRMALVAGIGLAAGVATGGVMGRVTQPGLANKGGQSIDPTGGQWIDVAAMSDLKDGQPMQVKAGSVGAFVFRRGETVTAVSSICSHLPCELWWDGEHSLLSCPCHPATFTSDGLSTDHTYNALPALIKVQVRVTSTGRVEVLGTA